MQATNQQQPNVHLNRRIGPQGRQRSKTKRVLNGIFVGGCIMVCSPTLIIMLPLLLANKLNGDRRERKVRKQREKQVAEFHPPKPPLHAAESKIGRRVIIEKSHTLGTLAKCHDQRQSPLFDKLPGELRNEIFAYAAGLQDDPQHPYKPTDLFYRPGHHARQITSPALLLTCRRIFLEANQEHAKQARQAEHFFWFADRDRRPAWAAFLRPKEDDYLNFILQKHLHSRPPPHHVHIFCQTYWLERRSHTYIWLGSFRTGLEILTITIRHTDWQAWENDGPLVLDLGCFFELIRGPICHSSRLREIHLELESLEHKTDQLREVVRTIREMQIQQQEATAGGVLPWTLLGPSESPPDYTWSGTTRLGGQSRTIYQDREQLDYRVITLVWRPEASFPRSADSSDDSIVDGSSHVESAGPNGGRRFQTKRQSRKMKEWEQRWETQGSLLRFAD